MSFKEIIANNLVISAVPPEDNYENEQFEKPDPEIDEYADE